MGREGRQGGTGRQKTKHSEGMQTGADLRRGSAQPDMIRRDHPPFSFRTALPLSLPEWRPAFLCGFFFFFFFLIFCFSLATAR